MSKIGLALSGGGFRASLYHLGLIRFLRDADILSQVTHITSVSGGSIIGAHLVLNWDRYNSSPEDFDAVASELLSFVNLDIRNRIVRRFPLSLPFRLPRRLVGLSNRRLTRTGLLERHYEKYLYGDTSLFELPEKPKLHILSTNVSEGCLCSFNRDGLLMVRRQPGKEIRMDRIPTGLATVAMAVTSSSAFAGFFPPIELTGAEVGLNEGEFGRQAYTDGGVFDNLGVRMFHCLEPQILAESPLSRDDFLDPRAAVAMLAEAAKSYEETPLRHLAQIVQQTMNGQWPHEERVLTCLSDIVKHHQFQADPLFQDLKLADPDAEALFRACRVDRGLEPADQIRLNRYVLEAAFREAAGHPCFRRFSSGLDAVLVSDVGKHIQVESTNHAGGLIRTALRATDILMERVWELENENFQDTAGFVFAPINQLVDPHEDPTALHPEIQRHLPNIRTDLDRFSRLEISSLVQHGYCVARKVCREHAELFGSDLPGNSPWDPVGTISEADARPVRVSTARRPWSILRGRWRGRLPAHAREPSSTTVKARVLQGSAGRRIWQTLLDYRDWTSFVYVPLLVPLITLLPYFVTRYYEWTHRSNLLIQSLSQGSPAVAELSRLLRDGPDRPWVGVRPEPAGRLDALDFSRFEILQVSHTIDLRLWNTDEDGQSTPSSRARIYRTIKVRKEVEQPGEDIFRYRLFGASPAAAFRFPRQDLKPHLRMACDGDGARVGPNDCRWEVSYDFTAVPAGEWRQMLVQSDTPATFLERGRDSTVLPVEFPAAISEVNFWILMPRGRRYRSWQIVRHDKRQDRAEALKPATEFLADDFQILAFKLLAVKPRYRYDISWTYK